MVKEGHLPNHQSKTPTMGYLIHASAFGNPFSAEQFSATRLSNLAFRIHRSIAMGGAASSDAKNQLEGNWALNSSGPLDFPRGKSGDGCAGGISHVLATGNVVFEGTASVWLPFSDQPRKKVTLQKDDDDIFKA